MPRLTPQRRASDDVERIAIGWFTRCVSAAAAPAGAAPPAVAGWLELSTCSSLPPAGLPADALGPRLFVLSVTLHLLNKSSTCIDSSCKSETDRSEPGQYRLTATGPQSAQMAMLIVLPKRTRAPRKLSKISLSHTAQQCAAPDSDDGANHIGARARIMPQKISLRMQ